MHKYIYPVILFILPLLFFTYTSNFFSTPKQIFLIVGALLLILNIAFESITQKKIVKNNSTIRYGLVAFAIVILVNLLLNPVNRLESLIGPGSLYLALIFWAYSISQNPEHKLKERILVAIIGSGTILSLHTLAQLTFLYKIISLPIYMQTRSFTLTGAPLTTFILMVMGAAASTYLTLNYSRLKPILIFSTTVQVIAIIGLGALFFPGQALAINILPIRASWNIALDAMKTGRSLFFGVGLSNFPIFYSTVKPLFLNTTSFWNVLPSTASSEILQIITTTGILGIASFLSLPIIALKSAITKDPFTSAIKIMCLLSLLALTLTPGSIPVLLIFFTTIGLLASAEPNGTNLKAPNHLIVALISLSIVGIIGYYTTIATLAEIHMRNAQVAISNNDGKTLYEQSLKATELLPDMTAYRLAYSQVNLSLATALSQKVELSETERTNVTTLVSQAVREGKMAISLSPQNSAAWQNLGFIYQKLINVTEDNADQFALDAYGQAVKYDPGNPSLRVEYGGLLYQLAVASKDKVTQNNLYSRAQSEFQTAIQLKPDYPNAYYNLAKLLESVGDYANSASVMQKAISLLGPNNPDLTKANTELEDIKAKIPKSSPIPAKTPTPSAAETIENPETSISAPSPLPSPITGGPISIPPTEPTI